jgi:hypothetical protein
MTRSETERDEQLGRALRELPAPPHGTGFEARLHYLLEQEASRIPARRWHLRPALRGGATLVAAAALAALLVALVALLPGDEARRIGPERADAAAIVARAQTALGRVRSLSAVLVARERLNANGPLRTDRLSVALTGRGDVRVLGDRDNGDLYYSVIADRQTQLRLPYTPRSFVMTGVAPGEPDGFIGDRDLDLQAAAVTRALAAVHDASVTTGRVRGRSVWVLRTAVAVNKLGFSGDRLSVTVDRTSGFPVAVRETLRGRLVREFELLDLRLNRPMTRRMFAPSVPAGTPTAHEGFRDASLSAAARLVGYAPLVPTRLPQGLARAETRVARTTPSPTGDESLNPPSVGVVSTAHRRGLDRVIVTTRRTGASRAAWSDPIAAGEGNVVKPEDVPIRAGALRGAIAHVVLNPRVVPHAWVVTKNLVVTVSGALTRSELLTAVASMRPVR